MNKHYAWRTALAGLALVTSAVLTVPPAIGAPATTSLASVGDSSAATTPATGRTPEEAQRLLAELEARLPAGTRAEFDAFRSGGRGDGSLVDSLIRAAIDPADHVCSAASPVLAYVQAQMATWDGFDQGVWFLSQFWELPVLDAILFPQPVESYGRNGEHSQAVGKSFRTLTRFWDIADEPINVSPMHGTMLIDPERVSRILRLRGMSAQNVEFYTNLFTSAVNTEKFQYGNHPAFTFNAFAAEGEEFAQYGIAVQDSIVMGDGVLETFDVLGFEDVAGPAIMAHEYGHQIQYRKGLFTGVANAEAARRLELMADAYAAYHLTHARGAAMQAKRVEQFSQVFRAIGDCNFEAPGHHGTPNQRVRAAQWGYALTESAANQGHVLPSRTVGDLFDQALPTIVAPDAGN